MSEHRAVRDLYIKLAIVIVCASLYMIGGWGDFLGGAKWLRRFIAPCIFSGGLFYFSRDWKVLVSAPLLMIGSSLGYGADSTFMSVIKRAYCGLVLGIGSSASGWMNKRFIFSISQTFLVTAGMIYLGVANPLSDARVEEFTIAMLIYLIPMMAIRRK